MLSGIAICASATPAFAQGEETAAQERRFGGDIIVTAERRETNLQETPLSIVAVTEEVLEAKGIENLSDLSRFTPGLNITPGRGSGNASPYFSIRGIGGGGGATGERGVGLYIDGVFVPRTSGSLIRVLDIDRVEILRGPQGTLFGRNSTGGAIRIFTKQPQMNSTEGYVKVTAANMDRADVVGAVNVPISDNAALRVQGAYLRQGGWVERGTQMLGESEDYIARASLRITPSDRFEMNLGFLYSDASGTSSPSVFEEFDMRPGVDGVIQGNYADWLNDSFKAAGQAPLAAYNDPRLVRGDFTAPDICLLDDFNPDWDKACEQYETNRYWQADLRMTYELSDTVSLASTTGLARLDHESTVDWQMIGTEDRHSILTSDTFYQELQLNAELFGGAVSFVTGGSYFHEKSVNDGLIITRRGTSTFTPQAANGNGDAGLKRRDDIVTTQTSDSIGIFGSATWHITDRLNFTGGLRYANDKKDFTETEYPNTDFTPLPGTTSTTVWTDHSWEQVDWRASLDYNLTPDWMWYATVSKAYKAGTFSGINIISNLAGDKQSGDYIVPVDPEQVINYETGMRIEAFDKRVRFNPTVFYMQWSNRQAARQVTCSGADCPNGFRIQVVNSGDVDVYGIELDAQVSVTDNLFLDGQFGYTGFEVKDITANGGPNLLPGPPEFSYNFGATYVAELGVGELTLNANYAYTASQPTYPTSTGDSAYDLPAIEVVNARATFKPDNAPVRISVFANNLLNNTYATWGTRFGGGFWDNPTGTGLGAPPRSALSVVRGKPREVGISLQYDF